MKEQAYELVLDSSNICPLIPLPSIRVLPPVSQEIPLEGVNQHRVDEGGVLLAVHHVAGVEGEG